HCPLLPNPSFCMYICISICICKDSGLIQTRGKNREYMDLIIADAIIQFYRDMCAHHNVHDHSIQITKVEEIIASKCYRPAVKQFHDSKIKFLLQHRVLCHQHKSCFITKRLNAFF
uniref:Large ribosomal subunit protein eL20 n=1 Tax=Terrapene triunguis TaxID=2587831 RepID=A0A674I7D1_9SAUR